MSDYDDDDDDDDDDSSDPCDLCGSADDVEWFEDGNYCPDCFEDRIF